MMKTSVAPAFGPFNQSRMMRAGIHLSKNQKAEALADVQYLIDHPTPGLDLKKLKQFKERLEEE